MGVGVWVFGGAIALALLAWVSRGSGGLERAISEALNSHEAGPLREVLGGMDARAKPTAYNQAIARLWDKFERNLACDLIADLAQQCHEADITQYWIQRAIQTEPAIARERFSEDFLSAYYRPDIAARCGKFG